jgi:hypothetical protein
MCCVFPSYRLYYSCYVDNVTIIIIILMMLLLLFQDGFVQLRSILRKEKQSRVESDRQPLDDM